MEDWILDHPGLVMFIVAVLALSGFAYIDHYVSSEMQRLHCVGTGNTRTQVINTPMISGNVIIMIPNLVTENEYTCDDGKRWY